MKPETSEKVDAWFKNYKENPNPESIVALFQGFIDTGEIMYMDTYYREVANKLIANGFCHRPVLSLVTK